jgi:hypothetical protein
MRTIEYYKETGLPDSAAECTERLFCDRCRLEYLSLYDYDGHEFCWECLLDTAVHQPKCDKCGAWPTEVYELDNKLVCADCLETMVNKIEVV